MLDNLKGNKVETWIIDIHEERLETREGESLEKLLHTSSDLTAT